MDHINIFYHLKLTKKKANTKKFAKFLTRAKCKTFIDQLRPQMRKYHVIFLSGRKQTMKEHTHCVCYKCDVLQL